MWEIIISITIILLFAGLGIYLGIKAKKRMDSNYKSTIDFDKIDVKISYKIIELFSAGLYSSPNKAFEELIWPKEVEFYDMYRTLLPKEYLMVPKVGVDKIVKPHGSLLMYNAIKTKYVDFCIFKRSNMEPVVVIDCFYPSITDSSIKEMDKAVKKSLEAVSIPVLQYEILDVPYDKDAVIKRFYDALDPVALAQLRKKAN